MPALGSRKGTRAPRIPLPDAFLQLCEDNHVKPQWVLRGIIGDLANGNPEALEWFQERYAATNDPEVGA